ncbi:PhoX family protein [Candidatus Oscillochloris fontis]|uniref:PhoX family protein n=1 Tax=Candidatus Oscillochloris fontis TaxID=2496868 RepID=UPI00101BF226|nr:PhoX family phosphatase [Candidatus Oscillochloris fontis]
MSQQHENKTLSLGETIEEIMNRRMSRRDLLKGAVGVTSAAMLGALGLRATNAAAAPTPALRFASVTPTAPTFDDVVVPEGYYARTLIRWGEPLTTSAPTHNVWEQTPQAQAEQFGYNCDFVGFLPLPFGSNVSDHGLLFVSHEYTNPELMFPNYDFNAPTRNQVDIELAAHGVSVVEVRRAYDGTWNYVRNSQYNRRITGETPIRISGPVAGHEWLKTSEDPTGTLVRGTLNNCAGGKTPWGTVLTAEENFHQYFGNLSKLSSSDPRVAVHKRYGVPAETTELHWEAFHARFDVSQEPNEVFRFGWMVEIDPYDPTFTPVKRTALGRFRHEAATIGIAKNGQVVAYSGDDQQFEYVYKFITKGTYNAKDRKANFGILDEGTLYVAKFNDDGSGVWMPLVYGQGPLTAANGFTSQADVLINTRKAADLLGATKMDRPEDIEPNPVNKKIYIALTNNSARGTEGKPGVDAANPRAKNRTGQVIELTEAGDDYASLTFKWELLLLCGLPSDESTYFAGYDKSKVSPIACPDNVMFDNAGNLWIATDGAANGIKYNDGLFVVPVSGKERGHVQQFFSSVAGSEVCGPELTPDNRTVFLAIQHPGEGGTFESPVSTWPDRVGLPRPSVLTIQAFDSRVIGS